MPISYSDLAILKLEKQNQMLESIRTMQIDFINQGIVFGWCDRVLARLLKLSESQFGFICELLYKEDGTPFLRSHGITNIAWDETTRRFYDEHADSGLEFFNFDSLWGAAIRSGNAVIANNPETDTRRGGYPKEQGHPRLDTFLALPIKSPSGTILGVMGVANRPGGYQSEDVEFLSPFTSTYGILIENHRERAKRKEADDKLREAQARYQRLVENVSDEYSIFTHDTDGHLTYISPSISKILGYAPDELRVNFERLLTDHPLNQEAISRTKAGLAGIRQPQYLMELLHKDGSRRWVEVSEGPVFSNDGAVVGMEGIVHDVTERQKTEKQVWHQANFDALTDLPNRALFFDRLSHEISAARRKSKHLALLFLDLDGFKAVNDQYGHEAGDNVLKTVTHRWRQSIRDTDTLARIGGDEFAIIINELEDIALVEVIAQKLINALDADIPLQVDQSCSIGVSIGIGIYPDNAFEMDSLLTASDQAMYKSKANGKNRITFAENGPASPSEKVEWVKLEAQHIIGIEEIDRQHQKIAEMVNLLNKAITEKEEVDKISTRFDELIRFTHFHFETEHQMMLAAGYPDMVNHDIQHEGLLRIVKQLAIPPYQGRELLILQTIKDWLLLHVRHADADLGRFLLHSSAAHTASQSD